MKKLLLTLTVLLGLTVAAFAVRLMITGAGIGYAGDPASADMQADQQAQNNLNMSCGGWLVASQKIQDSCTGNIGSDDNPKFMCTVTYRGICQIGR